MGLTHVTTRVSNLAGDGAPYEADFLVDTGAVDCLGPTGSLQAAGIQPEGKAVYELANGEPVEYEYGFARVALLGQETVVQIIFGPEDANTDPRRGGAREHGSHRRSRYEDPAPTARQAAETAPLSGY